MKVCHLTSAHHRYDVRIFEKECSSLTEAGYEVYLVVNDDLPDEEKNGVHIVSTKFCPVGRKERMKKSPAIVLNKALEIDAEVYQLHDPELLRIATKLVKIGKKVIFDAHEDTETQIRDKSWIPKILRIPISKLYAQYAKSKIQKLSGVISVTPGFVDKFSKYNHNTALVTNYPIVSRGNNCVSNENADDVLTKYVFFAGGVSEQWCHEKIAAAINSCKDIHYYIAGRGEEEYIQKISQNNTLIKYLGVLPHNEVEKLYKNSLAGLAILNCAQVGKEGTLGNTKLFEVMQAGKPVICSDLRLWKEIVEKYRCGICVDANSVDSIKDAIGYISAHPKEAKEMGQNGEKAIMLEYNWETQAKSLVDFYKRLS